jgi:DivIVA domain-containing protein
VEDLQPDDIVGYRFKQSLRGYAVDEVDQLLDRIADQLERMAAEMDDLRGRVHVAETQAAVTRETEATLQRTLVVAQQAAERNLADAAAQAEATLANATAEVERLRREVEEEVGRSRTEAEAEVARLRADAAEEAARLRTEAEEEAAGTLERAQALARREVQAARGRVEEAASRHAEVVRRVGEHRDALRHELANLEELVLAVPPSPRMELVVGELPPEVAAPPVDHHADDDAAAAPAPADADGHLTEVGERALEDLPPPPSRDDAAGPIAPPSPLTVRVHEDRPEGSIAETAPLGSGERDGS